MNLHYHRPHLYPEQEAAIFCQERIGLVEASTKSGKTAGAMVWLLEQAMRGSAGENYWWVAPIYRQAKIPFRRMKRSIPRGVYHANESELTIKLANGAVIWFKGSDDPDSLYGEDVHAAVMDEASRCKEEAWHAVRSTLTATRGPVRIIGNVRGRKNWAYKLARRAEAGEPDMHYSRITWEDAVRAGVLDRQEIDDACSVLPEQVFRQLYEAEAAEDEGNPFGIENIRACIRPKSEADVASWGVDLARAVDYTVAIGLDESANVCRFGRWRKPWRETQDSLLAMLGDVPALVDSTGVGDPVVEHLQRERPTIEGFQFTAKSKQQLMEDLARAIHGREIGYPEGPIVLELEAFEYEYRAQGVRYSAPDGMHDDCVMALALAWRRLREPAGEWWVA